MNQPNKLKYLFILPLLIFVIMVGMRIGMERQYEDTELPPLPANAEYLEYMEAHRQEDTTSYEFAVQLRLAQLSDDEIHSHFETILGEWLEKQTVSKIKSADLKVSNTLAVSRGSNQLWFNDVQIDLDLTLAGDTVVSGRLSRELIDDLDAFLARDVYGIYKTGIVNLRVTSANGITSSEQQRSNYTELGQTTRAFYDGTIWPEEETHTLTLAYDCVRELADEIIPKDTVNEWGLDRRLPLTHFGIRPETQDLYIRVEVIKKPADFEGYTAGLPGYAGRLADVADVILQDKTAVQWLNTQSAKDITICFAPLWADGLEEHVFQYPVK